MQKFLRGQVWFYNEPNNKFTKYNAQDSVQRGSRPVIIVSNNTGNKHSPVITVVPCTTQGKADLPTHFNFLLDATTNTVLCEQIFTVGKSDLATYRGTLDATELSMLNRCLSAALLLNEPQIIIAPPTQHEQLVQKLEDRLPEHTKTLIVKEPKISGEQKRSYIKRTDEEKDEIITAYCSTCKKEELEELAQRYKFTNSKMLIQSVDRWMNK